MRRINPRLLIGSLLVVGGLLSLLDVMGVISNAGGIFWGLVFGIGGLAFLYLLFTDQTNNWWAAFPGFTRLGLAISSFLPDSLDGDRNRHTARTYDALGTAEYEAIEAFRRWQG